MTLAISIIEYKEINMRTRDRLKLLGLVYRLEKSSSTKKKTIDLQCLQNISYLKMFCLQLSYLHHL